MKCPLLGLNWQDRAWAKKAEQTDCIKEECAWWFQEGERCCVRELTVGLSLLAKIIEFVQRLMLTEHTS